MCVASNEQLFLCALNFNPTMTSAVTLFKSPGRVSDQNHFQRKVQLYVSKPCSQTWSSATLKDVAFLICLSRLLMFVCY